MALHSSAKPVCIWKPIECPGLYGARYPLLKGAILKSRVGLALATIYLVVSVALLFAAMHCRDDFFCGITAIPVLIPAGVVYLLLFSEYLANPPILQWPLLIPTLMTNAVLYYLIGRLVGRQIDKIKQRRR